MKLLLKTICSYLLSVFVMGCGQSAPVMVTINPKFIEPGIIASGEAAKATVQQATLYVKEGTRTIATIDVTPAFSSKELYSVPPSQMGELEYGKTYTLSGRLAGEVQFPKAYVFNGVPGVKVAFDNTSDIANFAPKQGAIVEFQLVGNGGSFSIGRNGIKIDAAFSVERKSTRS